MGTFSYAIEIGDPQGQRYERIEALVDTGASYTTLPASLLRRLGVQPMGRRRFRIANGGTMVQEIGQTWIRIDDEAYIQLVVFGPEDQALLGAFSLEGFGLAVDPLGKRLVPVEGLLM
ncbi:MAG: hypothetical protein EXR53_00365 [Dehalococcoidia bacterium]|nr:hypothetical protein [Dehalococcoidia bacterium]